MGRYSKEHGSGPIYVYYIYIYIYRVTYCHFLAATPFLELSFVGCAGAPQLDALPQVEPNMASTELEVYKESMSPNSASSTVCQVQRRLFSSNYSKTIPVKL